MAVGGEASKLSLKLLIDTKGDRVLFAEADKKTVDFLLLILTFPMAILAKLFKDQQVSGGMVNLYESVENLSGTHISQPDKAKETLLNQVIPPAAANILGLPQPPEKVFYKCTSGTTPCSWFVSDMPDAICPVCWKTLSGEMIYVPPPAAAEEGGFVKEAVTYMVMDDLVVKPMSIELIMALLNKFEVNKVGDLKEKMVDLGIKEALNLLKTSLSSCRILTSVFLRRM